MKISIMKNPTQMTDLEDWGPVPTMIEGQSQTHGKSLYASADGKMLSGYWECSPGKFKCVVDRDEFAHFLNGRAIYVHDNGEVTEVTSDTAAFFPKGWSGTCTVEEHVKKLYMIV